MLLRWSSKLRVRSANRVCNLHCKLSAMHRLLHFYYSTNQQFNHHHYLLLLNQRRHRHRLLRSYSVINAVCWRIVCAINSNRLFVRSFMSVVRVFVCISINVLKFLFFSIVNLADVWITDPVFPFFQFIVVCFVLLIGLFVICLSKK